ncbi:porin family protein [Aliarcobacter cryaerophilus]|uniref:porin family protein n=1 Tax=Aliarcobacter cryaerophilus TaxID=28198 RepID=UPI0021B50D5C|nr:porin family protein [Aliarcobacter cryaerophilus]MCT7462275.1 porin family protein [Aliarcobacter cryaerophilus]
MIKKSLVMASLLALGTSAIAIDIQPYVGAGAGANWAKVKASAQGNVSGNAINLSESDTESSFTAKIQGGVILDNTHRISLAYAPAFNSDANVHNVMAGYDYLIPVNNDSRVYVGAHLGSTSFKGKKNLDGVDDTGFAYGLQTGYIYDITKNIEFEFGLNYTRHDVEKTYSARNGADWINVKAELDYSIGTMVGINYKF